MAKTLLHHRRFKSSFNNKDHNNLLNSQDDEEIEEKFNNEKTQFDHIPWKGITLALILTLIGSFIIVVFICSQMGWIEFKPDDNFTFLTLAFITLVPGFYHCLIAFRAFRGYEGYSFDDIADLN